MTGNAAVQSAPIAQNPAGPIYRALKNLGFSHVSARPKACKQSAEAMDAFKKNFAERVAEIRAKLAPDTPVEVWFLLDGRGSRIDRYLRDLRICFTGAACPPGAGQCQFDHFSTHDHSFGPEDIAKMSAAFEAALGNLGLVDRSDPLTYEVAKLIIEFAKQGERDPERLCALTLQQLSK